MKNSALRKLLDQPGDDLRARLKQMLETEKSLPGAPMVWNVMRLFYLWWDVQTLGKRGLSARAACSRLAGTPEWRGFNAPGLRDAYGRCERSPMVEFAHNVIAKRGWDATANAFARLCQPEVRDELSEHLRQIEKLDRSPPPRK